MEDPGYQIFTDATADLSVSMQEKIPNVQILPMQIEVDGVSYACRTQSDMPKFYDLLSAGKTVRTTQITPLVYREAFEKVLQAGKDILYLCFSSGLSGTYNSAMLCAEELMEEYPKRSIFCVDTRCASLGEGLLVYEAAHRQQEGMDIETLRDWVLEHRLQVCHWFTVDRFDELKRGGRVSAASAAVGHVLDIKPLLDVNEEGRLVVCKKPRGRRKAIGLQMEHMEQGWLPELSRTVIVGDANEAAGAQQLEQAVLASFPEAEIIRAPIGPVIGAHTGPGMLALIYWGNNR